MEKFITDKLVNCALKLSQPEKGYRFSIDSLILAAHVIDVQNIASLKSGNKKIIDIGCGCGIISVLIATKFANLKITGIEIQEELFYFAKKNICANKLENIVNVLHKDIGNVQINEIGGKADIVVSNPPYKKRNSGRLNPDLQKAIARHEIALDIDMLFKCSNKLLKEKGKLYLIFPASRVSDLFAAMERYKFTPDFIRFIHSKNSSAAKRIILCSVKNSKKLCTVYSPFYIHSEAVTSK